MYTNNAKYVVALKWRFNFRSNIYIGWWRREVEKQAADRCLTWQWRRRHMTSFDVKLLSNPKENTFNTALFGQICFQYLINDKLTYIHGITYKKFNQTINSRSCGGYSERTKYVPHQDIMSEISSNVGTIQEAFTVTRQTLTEAGACLRIASRLKIL